MELEHLLGRERLEADDGGDDLVLEAAPHDVAVRAPNDDVEGDRPASQVEVDRTMADVPQPKRNRDDRPDPRLGRNVDIEDYCVAVNDPSSLMMALSGLYTNIEPSDAPPQRIPTSLTVLPPVS